MKNKTKNRMKHAGFVALPLVFALLLLLLPTISALAADSPFDVMSTPTVTVDSETLLKQAINGAGTTPTWIELGGSVVDLSGTVTIPANAVIKISGGTLQGPRDAGNKFRILNVVANAYLESEDVVVTGGWAPSDWSYYNAGGGVGVAGEFVMKSGRITANTGGRGGGVAVTGNSARFTLYDGKIDNNLSPSSSGGGVLVEEAALFTMKGGKIADNTASSGGGVYISSMFGGSASFDMEGGVISGNSADGGLGGGVYVDWYTHFSMEAGLIANNTAYSGGGVYSDLLYAVIQNPYTSGSFNDLRIGAGAVFSGNTSDALYKMTNNHEVLYAEVVNPGAVFSFPEEALSSPPNADRLTGFNDFDIGYMKGTPIYYPPVYTVGFAANGGTGQMDPVLVGASAPSGRPPYTLTLPPNTFTWLGYSFTGWLANDLAQTEYADGAVASIAQDMILSAQWLPVPPAEYTVSFEAGGGTGGMASASVTEGDDYTLPPNAFMRPGYDFTGWLADDVASTPYADEATIENIVQDIELTAQWRYIDSGGGDDEGGSEPSLPPVARKYTVSFAGGGGAGSMASASVTEGGDYTLPPNAFTRPGYDFTGWLADDAASTPYADEATIENIVQDIELTARWRADGSEDITEPLAQPPESPAQPPDSEESMDPGLDFPPVSGDMIPDDDGVYIEMNDEGNPLGEWHWDESGQEWVFEPYQPLDDLPKTGGSGLLLWPMLAAFSAGALALRFAAGKRRI